MSPLNDNSPTPNSPVETPRSLKLGRATLSLDRPRIMAILNLTPDSFSDGGLYPDEDAAVEAGLRMAEEGADLIDVGAESTRPGAVRIDAGEQIRRLGRVIPRLRQALDQSGLWQVVISIDTTRVEVAGWALDAGAGMVNDVSAGRDDPKMFRLAVRSGAGLVLMHMLGQPETMQQAPRYGDVVEEVRRFLLEQAAGAEAEGVAREQILIDPGIGFGKTTGHNLQLLAKLDRFAATGYPVLLGTSRKRFLREVVKQGGGESASQMDLDLATAVTTALGVAAGVAVFRVHHVPVNRVAAQVAWGIVRASRES